MKYRLPRKKDAVKSARSGGLIYDVARREPDSGTTEPSEINVEAVKRAVDENQL